MSKLRRLPVLLPLLAAFWLVFRDEAIVGDKPFIEDAFYSLGVARHLGTGGGFSVDGVHPSNGVQPLWVVLTAPLYWLTGGERVFTLRLVQGLLALLWVGTALGFGRLARLWLPDDVEPETADLAATTASLIAVGSPYLWRHAFNGLETGLHLCALTWFVWLYVRTPVTTKGRALLGLALGMLVLIRIDVPFLVVLLAVVELFRGGDAVPRRFLRAALLSGLALVVSAPWWIYNQVVFGSLMPTSGHATGGSHWGEWGSIRLILDAVFTGALPPLWIWTYEYGSVAIEWVRFLLATPLFLWIGVTSFRRLRSTEDGADDRRRALGWFAAAFLVFIVVLSCWYLARSRMNFFYGRYLIPTAVLCVPAVGALAACCVRRVGRTARIAWWGAAVVACALGCALPLTSAVVGAGNILYRHNLHLIERHVPPGERVGAWQSGTISYFRDGVVNLDGKVNPDLIGFAVDRRRYMEENGIDWAVENHVQMRLLLGREDERAPWVLVDKAGVAELWHRSTE